MPGFLSAFILFVMLYKFRWFKLHLIFFVIIHILVIIQILFYVVPIHSDDTFIGWETLAEQAEKLENEYPNHFIFSKDSYKTSAAIMFYNNQKIYGENILSRPGLHFDYIGDDLDRLTGKDAIYIDSNTRFQQTETSEKHSADVQDHFNNIIPLDPIVYYRNGKPARKWSVFECKNYQGPIQK